MGWLEEAGLSVEFVERCIFVPGGAFRQAYQFRDEGFKRRYFFVLNKAPSESDDIVLVTSTRQINKTFRHRYYRVLVTISPTEYDALTEDSVVDCSQPIIKPRTTIVSAIRRKKITLLSPLPANILQKLKQAIGEAQTIEPKIKTLVLGEEETNEGSPS